MWTSSHFFLFILGMEKSSSIHVDPTTSTVKMKMRQQSAFVTPSGKIEFENRHWRKDNDFRTSDDDFLVFVSRRKKRISTSISSNCIRICPYCAFVKQIHKDCVVYREFFSIGVCCARRKERKKKRQQNFWIYKKNEKKKFESRSCEYFVRILKTIFIC